MKVSFALAALASLAHAQTVPKWRLVEDWRKGGGIEGPYAFDGMFKIRYSNLAAAPGGRIIMLDAETSRVHIYDSTGAVIRSIGRAGSGPAEFRTARGIAVTHDGRLVVNDPGNGRLVIFAATGDFDHVVTMTRRPPFAFDIAWDGSFDASGRMLQSLPVLPAQPRPGDGGPPMADSALMTERVSVDLLHSDTIALCHSPRPAAQDPARYVTRTRVSSMIPVDGSKPSVPPAPISVTSAIPFTEQRSAFVRDREGFAWSATSIATGELVRTDGRNCSAPTARAMLRGARAPIPPVIRDKAIADEKPDMRAVIPREYPWFRALRVDDQNRLWVERDVAAGRRFDVFNAAGRAVAEVDLPTQMVTDLPIAIANNHVYGFVKDADEVPYLVAWKVLR